MSRLILSIFSGCEVKTVTSTTGIDNKTYNSTLDSLVEKINRATTIEDLSRACSLSRDHYGFDFYTLMIRCNRFDERPICFSVREFDNDWSYHYIKNDCLMYDPGVRISINCTTPFLWSSQYFENLKKFLSPLEIDHCRRAQDFGVRDVFNAPFHNSKFGSYGLIRFVRFATGQASNSDIKINRHKISELYYLASHIYQSLSLLFGNSEPKIHLSEREKDVLLWVALGKNPASISYNLNISENTVCKHLSNIRAKLNVKNTTHAVAKAMSAGLINI